MTNIKGSSDPNHYIFEINVGKRRIRHTTTLMDSKSIVNGPLKNQIQIRYMSDPPVSDIDFKNIMVLIWTTLK